MFETAKNHNVKLRKTALTITGLGLLAVAAKCGKGEQAPTYTHTTVAALEGQAAAKHCPDGEYVQLTATVAPHDDPSDKSHHYYKIAGASHLAIREAISDPSNPAMAAGAYSVSGQVESVGAGRYACVIDEVGMARQ